MYKTKQNYLRFKNHEIFSDKFSKEYPKEQQATFWYNIWYLINNQEGQMTDWNFDHHEVGGGNLMKKWKELWPFPDNKMLGGAPAFQRVPVLVDGTQYLGVKYNFPTIWTGDPYRKKDKFSIQVLYGVLVEMFNEQIIKIDPKQVEAFLNPLKEYNLIKYGRVRHNVIKAIVGMADFFMNTKDVWIETKEFGDWREMDSLRKIEQWKEGYVDHNVPEDYPLDKTKIIDHRKGVDDNRWTREKPFLDEEDIYYGQREEI